jgi:hypothetical protein
MPLLDRLSRAIYGIPCLTSTVELDKICPKNRGKLDVQNKRAHSPRRRKRLIVKTSKHIPMDEEAEIQNPTGNM